MIKSKAITLVFKCLQIEISVLKQKSFQEKTKKNMIQTKHIAMWTAPRSRSTLIARAFEQLDECWLIDQPFYPPYALTNDFGNLREKLF